MLKDKVDRLVRVNARNTDVFDLFNFQEYLGSNPYLNRVRTPKRNDTPNSPMGKIQTDESMYLYLSEQGLDLDSVIESDRVVYLRKVANLSSGGFSIDATNKIHPDNIIY